MRDKRWTQIFGAAPDSLFTFDFVVPAYSLSVRRRSRVRCLYGCRFGIYGDQYGEFGDNGYRFAAFSRAVIEACKHLEWIPDVVHAHDWHTAPAMAYLAAGLYDDDPMAHAGRVFTIHNQAYQGFQGKSWVSRVGLPPETFHDGGLAQGSVVNLLKGGVQYAHKVTTVSPTYAWEIRTREGGFGLEGTMNYRAGDLVGILNGIDMEEWNPQTDPHIEGMHFHSEGRNVFFFELSSKMALNEGGFAGSSVTNEDEFEGGHVLVSLLWFGEGQVSEKATDNQKKRDRSWKEGHCKRSESFNKEWR